MVDGDDDDDDADDDDDDDEVLNTGGTGPMPTKCALQSHAQQACASPSL